jgi:diaminopimelate decarboxylase
VVYDKPSGDKNFLVVDAAMNDLLRPSIYQAFHLCWPAKSAIADSSATGNDSLLEKEASLGKNPVVYDVVGPVCESGDYFALGRKLPRMAEGELLAVFSAGAYGMAMASNYNTRGRPAEVIVDGDKFWVARERETVEDQIRGERLTPRETYTGR